MSRTKCIRIERGAVLQEAPILSTRTAEFLEHSFFLFEVSRDDARRSVHGEGKGRDLENAVATRGGLRGQPHVRETHQQ